jgi:hypothetical protein
MCTTVRCWISNDSRRSDKAMLDGRGPTDRIPAQGKRFPLLKNAHSCCVAQIVIYSTDTRGTFPRDYACWGMRLTNVLPSNAKSKNECSYTSTHLHAFIAWTREVLSSPLPNFYRRTSVLPSSRLMITSRCFSFINPTDYVMHQPV